MGGKNHHQMTVAPQLERPLSQSPCLIVYEVLILELYLDSPHIFGHARRGSV